MLKNKALTLLAAGLLSAGSALAQNPDSYYDVAPRTFYGGIVGGVNFTQLDGDNYAGYHKVGFNGGGIVYARFDEHLAASIEILYSQKGARSHKEQQVAGAYIHNYYVNLNYAEVPLQLCYFDRRRSHFGAGFSISRLVSVKEEGEASTPGFPPTDFSQYPFKKMDYNFIIGGNLHLIKGLFLNARFQYSLVPVRKGEIGTDLPRFFSGRGEQYNNMWTVRMMYLF